MRILYRFLVILISLFAVSNFNAQTKKDSVKAKTDTAKTKSAAEAKKPEKIKPYKDVITAKAVSDEGIITVHKVEDKYFF